MTSVSCIRGRNSHVYAISKSRQRLTLLASGVSPLRCFSAPLFSSLLFPGAVNFRVRLNGELAKVTREDDCAVLCLDPEMTSIFRNVEQFARVERFHLEAYASNRITKYDAIILQIPLDVLPDVKHLTLQSNMYMELGTRATFTALHTINIDAPESWHIGYWAGSVLNMQKERGEWEEFRELLVRDEADSIWQRYAGDAALEWGKGLRSSLE